MQEVLDIIFFTF